MMTTPLTDPVAVLGACRRALYAEAVALVDTLDKRPVGSASDADDDKVSAAWDRVKDIERQMIPMVATTAVGIAEQVEVLRDFLARSEFEPLVDNIIAGVRRLAA